VEEIIVIGALVMIALFAAALVYRQRIGLRRLRAHYGPEYDRLAERGESPRAIRRDLIGREERVSNLNIVPLSTEMQAALANSWTSIQAKFVDEPPQAVSDAERLLEDVMRARGYPDADAETRLRDLSVHHSHVLANYREACDIATRHRDRRASTEDLRRAMVLYRDLFDDLVEAKERDREKERER
jgi:hypothetical protein